MSEASLRWNLATLLRQCRSIEDGRTVHRSISSQGLERNTFLGNLLVRMYGEFRSCEEAVAAFKMIEKKNVFSWNLLLGAYVENGLYLQAFETSWEMEAEGVHADEYTFTKLLGACVGLRLLSPGVVLHERVVAGGFESNVVTGTALIVMYGKCRRADAARGVFDRIQNKNVACWTAMMGVDEKKALQLYRTMCLEGLKPNNKTFMVVIDVVAELRQAEVLHAQVTESEIVVDAGISAAVIAMYCRCHSLVRAKLAFDSAGCSADIVCWTVMMAGYVEANKLDDAFELYTRFLCLRRQRPDAIFYVTSLRACSRVEQVEEMVAVIAAHGLKNNVAIETELINLYAKFGSLGDSFRTFNAMQLKNVISWTAMVTACCTSGLTERAFALYKTMHLEGVKPNVLTFTAILAACSRTQDARTVHAHILASVVYSVDGDLLAAVVNTYGSCGNLDEAREHFSRVHGRKTSVTWNAMIAAYSKHGHAEEALERHKEMLLEGVEPNERTFSSLLNACSHRGFLYKALDCFSSMQLDHGVAVSSEHYVCMVGLLGKAGRLREANEIATRVTWDENGAEAWKSLVGASWLHGDARIAESAARNVDKLDGATLVVLSNSLAKAVT